MIDPGIQVCVALYEHAGEVVLPVFVQRACKLQDLAIFEIRVNYI